MLLAKKQNFICPLCNRNFSEDSPKSLHLDHDHKNGMIRACLCSGCNKSEGKIKNVLQRFLSKIDMGFDEWAVNLVEYWDYHQKNPSNILHPDHKTGFDRKVRANEKAKKRRIKKKKEENENSRP